MSTTDGMSSGPRLSDLTDQARRATDALRDAAREGRIIDFRKRDRLVMAIHRALDAADALLRASRSTTTTYAQLKSDGMVKTGESPMTDHGSRLRDLQWEGDLSAEHPNRCKLRDRMLYADIFNDDGSHRAVWRCHKREGHEGPCSSHNDCGVMNGGVVCGLLPGHQGHHAWETKITLDSALLRASASAPPENKEKWMTFDLEDVRARSKRWNTTCYDTERCIEEIDRLRRELSVASASALSPEPAKEQLQREDYAVIAEAVTDFLGFDITTREQQDRITRWAALSPSSSPSLDIWHDIEGIWAEERGYVLGPFHCEPDAIAAVQHVRAGGEPKHEWLTEPKR